MTIPLAASNPLAMNRSPFKRGNETPLTYSLKWAAWQWLYNFGRCRVIGMEVKLEGPRGRIADLVGIGPENTIYIVEVKSTLADFSRDNHTDKDLQALLSEAGVLERRTSLARDILTQATTNAKQTLGDTWEQSEAYRNALSDSQQVSHRTDTYKARMASYSIKFHDRRFLGIADYHYIMAPRQVIPRRKLPPQWGLLDETPNAVLAAPQKDIRKNTGIVSNILRAIARSNTLYMMRAQGVKLIENGAMLTGQEVTKHCPSEGIIPGHRG